MKTILKQITRCIKIQRMNYNLKVFIRFQCIEIYYLVSVILQQSKKKTTIIRRKLII